MPAALVAEYRDGRGASWVVRPSEMVRFFRKLSASRYRDTGRGDIGSAAVPSPADPSSAAGCL